VDPAEVAEVTPVAVPHTGTTPLGDPQVEWAVEVTWRDWKKAGAKGPTSQYGPFETEEHRDSFLNSQRRDRAITATRVLTRLAAYTPWDPSGEANPTSQEERLRMHEQFLREVIERNRVH
jgi:hypothetical protein